MPHALLIDLDGVIRVWRTQEDPAAEAAFGLPPGAVRRVAFAPQRLQPVISGQISDELWRNQIHTQLAKEFPDGDAAGAVAWSECQAYAARGCGCHFRWRWQWHLGRSWRRG
jgi:hypothetical protein